MTITNLYSQDQDEAKKSSAEFLAAQVYQLYDERNRFVNENEDLKTKNADLQRLACSQRIELDKFTAYVRQDGCGPTASLIGKVEEL